MGCVVGAGVVVVVVVEVVVILGACRVSTQLKRLPGMYLGPASNTIFSRLALLVVMKLPTPQYL
jgi:hypothetical protein